ncbi:MAG: lipopolysaccharide biosynthesis protein [Pseudomonadota bacterium]|nr:lipopolysaccharide biosynthesis protein [Pseudomonadota bacterium]
MSRVNTAVIFSAMGQYATQIISFVTIIFIARILTPAEIGMFAIAASSIMIAGELRTFGVTQYLVREKELTRAKIQAVLGVAIGISWTLGLIVVFAAPFIADFYTEPALKWLLWILSVTFFVSPFGSIAGGLWTRELNFRPVFIRKVVSAAVNCGASISLVLLGYSYYGLAAGAILALLSELVVTIIYHPKNAVWIPRFHKVPGLLSVGFYISLTGMFSRFSENIPDLVIGRFSSTTSVGLFSRGLGAVLFIKRLLVQSVGPVVMPHLSEVRRSGGDVADAYLKAINLLVVVLWPVMAVASAAAYPMIRLLFGDQWDDSIPLTSIVALWAMLTYAHYFGNAAMIAVNHEKLMFQIGLISCSFLLVAVAFGASTQSLVNVAWGMVIAGMFEAVVYIWALGKAIGLKVGDLLRTLAPNMFIALCCWGVTKFIDYVVVFESRSAFFSITLIAPILVIVWLGLLVVMKHPGVDVLRKQFPGIAARLGLKGSA